MPDKQEHAISSVHYLPVPLFEPRSSNISSRPILPHATDDHPHMRRSIHAHDGVMPLLNMLATTRTIAFMSQSELPRMMLK